MAGSTNVLRSLAGLELAALRHHGVVRRRLNVGEEELSAAGRERLRGAFHELDAAAERLLAGRAPSELQLPAELLDALASTAYERRPDERRRPPRSGVV